MYDVMCLLGLCNEQKLIAGVGRPRRYYSKVSNINLKKTLSYCCMLLSVRLPIDSFIYTANIYIYIIAFAVLV